MKKTNRTVAALCALLLGVLLAGCGSSKSSLSDLSSTALLRKASTAVSGKHYVSLTGRIDQSGNKTGLDLHYVGDDSYGRITLSNDAQLELKQVGDKTWFKPNDAFWKAQMSTGAAAVIKVIAGRWILADPSNKEFGQVLELADRDFLTQQMLDSSVTATKGKPTKVRGIDCIPLKLKNGVMYLDEDNALPVRVTGNQKSGSGVADFSYAKVSAPTAPAAKDQVDLSALGG